MSAIYAIVAVTPHGWTSAQVLGTGACGSPSTGSATAPRRSSRGELGEEPADALGGLVADPAHAVEVGVGGVVELPVLVTLARVERTRCGCPYAAGGLPHRKTPDSAMEPAGTRREY